MRVVGRAGAAERTEAERGSVAVVVALCLVVFMGFGALVIDIGAVYQEKRELQNGADAAALAVAKDCANGACGLYTVTAETYADANADDLASDVFEVCGTATGLPGCAVPVSAPSGAKYVKVTTSTRDAESGGDQVRFGLAKIFGIDGKTVQASAVAALGSPGGLTSALPLTISLCEFETSTATGFAPPPPYTSGYPTETTLYFHDTTGASACPSGPAGSDLPGGFGWLDVNQDCVATTSADNWFDDKTGRPPPGSCDPVDLSALVGQIIYVPVFDAVNGLNGTNGEYHIGGYAAFFMTGYSILGQYKHASLVTGSFPCTGQASCISGFFTQSLASAPGVTFGGTDMGVTIVKMIG